MHNANKHLLRSCASLFSFSHCQVLAKENSYAKKAHEIDFKSELLQPELFQSDVVQAKCKETLKPKQSSLVTM